MAAGSKTHPPVEWTDGKAPEHVRALYVWWIAYVGGYPKGYTGFRYDLPPRTAVVPFAAARQAGCRVLQQGAEVQWKPRVANAANVSVIVIDDDAPTPVKGSSAAATKKRRRGKAAVKSPLFLPSSEDEAVEIPAAKGTS